MIKKYCFFRSTDYQMSSCVHHVGQNMLVEQLLNILHIIFNDEPWIKEYKDHWLEATMDKYIHIFRAQVLNSTVAHSDEECTEKFTAKWQSCKKVAFWSGWVPEMFISCDNHVYNKEKS